MRMPPARRSPKSIDADGCHARSESRGVRPSQRRRQKDEKKQLADLTQAIELQPDKPDYYRLRAEHYYGEKKYDDALDRCR